MAYYERLRAEIPPTPRRPAADPGRRAEDRAASSTRASASSRSRTCKAAAEAGTPPRAQGHLRQRPSSGSSRESRSSSRAPGACCSTAPRRIVGRPRPRCSTARPASRGSCQAGSLRRRRETIGDLDLLVETDDPDGVLDRFTGLGHGRPGPRRGPDEGRVTLLRGPQVDLMVMPPGEAGTYLVHFTGSADHNVRLRGIARDRGWSLSEKGFLRIDEDGRAAAPVTRPSCARSRPRPRSTPSSTCRTSSPSCARTAGEIEAARAGRLPTLITLARPARRPAQPLRLDRRRPLDRGHGRGRPPARLRLPGPDRPLAEPGHRARPGSRTAWSSSARSSPSSTRGSRREEARRRRARRRRRPRRLPAAPRLRAGGPRRRRSSTTTTTSSPGSTSSSRRSTSPAASRAPSSPGATLNAIRSPHVDVIAHPSGRMIQTPRRPRPRLGRGVRGRRATGTALEINGSPHRLDLAAERARRAVDVGCLLSIDSDAHRTEELDYVRWGDRPGAPGMGRARDTCSTRAPRDELLAWVAGQAGPRVSRGAVDRIHRADDLARRRLARRGARPSRARRCRGRRWSRSPARVEPADAFLVAGLLPVVDAARGRRRCSASGRATRRPYRGAHPVPAVADGRRRGGDPPRAGGAAAGPRARSGSPSLARPDASRSSCALLGQRPSADRDRPVARCCVDRCS